MKKIVAVAIILILLVSFVGCGERASDEDKSHSPAGPSASEGTETLKETKILEDNAVTVQANSEIGELEKGFLLSGMKGKMGFLLSLRGEVLKRIRRLYSFW